jgi:pilus assembly protein Flp/PilA
MTTKIRNRRGATAIEYGLLASLIAVVMILALTTVGGNISVTLHRINACLDDVPGPCPGL